MDDLPLDFMRYLSLDLGVTVEHATELLSSWLKNYEPGSFLSDGPGAASVGDAGESGAWKQTG
jgi:hypothetical protein